MAPETVDFTTPVLRLPGFVPELLGLKKKYAHPITAVSPVGRGADPFHLRRVFNHELLWRRRRDAVVTFGGNTG